MQRLFLIFILLLLPSALTAQEQERPVVRVVTTPFVLPAKFAALQAWAGDAGYRLEWRYVGEDAPTGQGDPAEGADMLVLDGPRPGDIAAVKEAFGPLDAKSVPWISVGGGPPGFGNLSAPVARRLIGYYAGGGGGQSAKLCRRSAARDRRAGAG